MKKKIKWLVNDLGLNELDAWLWITGGSVLTAAALVLCQVTAPKCGDTGECFS